MKTIPVKCAVSGCPNTLEKTGNKVKFHRFPYDDGVRAIWTVRCDRQDFWNPSNSFICSSHFTDDDYFIYSNNPPTKKLLPDAVPSRNLRLFGWDMDDAQVTGTGTDMSDAEDPFIRSMIKTSSRRTTETSPRPSHSRARIPVQRQRTYDSSEHSEAEFSGAEGSSKARKVRASSSSQARDAPKKKRNKQKYCCVLTCRAKYTHDFHHFPLDAESADKWVDAIYLGEPQHRVIRQRRTYLVCRRHFTEDDYLDSPRSGGARRLRRGAVPSVNLPICPSEIRLARLKLHLDLNRRKDVERNLSFQERLAREPELYELYQEYQEEVKDIDPSRVNVLPYLPANGELVGPGEPAPGDPSFLTKKQLKRIEKERRKDERAARKAELLEQRRQRKRERRKLYIEKKKELRQLFHSDPLAYHNLLKEDAKETEQERREQNIAARVARVAEKGDQVFNFSEKMEIVAGDSEKGTKYKVIVKKLIPTSKSAQPGSGGRKIGLDAAQGAELLRKVISKVDLDSTKRIKFITTNKITKLAPKIKQSEQKDESSTSIPYSEVDPFVTPEVGTSNQENLQLTGETHDPLASVLDDPTAQLENEEAIYQDDQDVYDDGDRLSDNEMYTEDVVTEEVGGPDHCYTNKTGDEEMETPRVDPFVELQETLRAMTEDEARIFVKEKMDGYRAIFKQQVSKIRQLLKTRQKTERKVKCLTRIMCSTLREQFVKYYS